MIFRDPMATYKAGDVVTGSVFLELAQEFKIKSVRLFLNGVSRVHWDEKRAYTKGSSSKLSHKNMDAYLDESIMIMGRPAEGSLNAGRYDWPFTVRLPPYLPASFEGQWGRVQYWAKVVVERPWKGAMDFTRNFVVLGSLDLNTEPEAKKQIDGTGDMMAGTLCCRSGPISGRLELARRGFVPGESIPFSARLHNESTKKLNCRVVLVQQCTFRADKEVRKTSTLLKGLTKGEIPPREEVEWEDQIKTIPQLPPTKLGGGCKNIEVKYILKLVAVASGPGSDLEVPVELILGTVPLRKTDPGTVLLTVRAAAKTIDGDVSPSMQARERKASMMAERQLQLAAAIKKDAVCK